MTANVIVFEVATIIFFFFFYAGANRALGKRRNRVFLVGSLLFSLVIENIAVLLGCNNFYWYSLNNYFKHYPLGGYIFWAGLVPVAVLLLFYMVSVTSFLAACSLVEEKRVIATSSVAGAIAMGFALLIEPVATTNHWWTWNLKTFYVFDIPLVVIVGVFISIFLFTATFNLTLVSGRDPAVLKGIEKSTIRKWIIKSDRATIDLDFDQLLWIFLFRLFFALVAFAVCITPFAFGFWLIANRAHIPPGW